MKLLIGYLILINLAGFLSMFFDKQRARRDKYRIPERQLFLIVVGNRIHVSLLPRCIVPLTEDFAAYPYKRRALLNGDRIVLTHAHGELG